MTGHRVRTGVVAMILALLVVGCFAEIRFSLERPDLLAWPEVVSDIYVAALALVFTIVGVAVLRRLPRHPIGWLQLALGAIVAVGFFGSGYLRWPEPPAAAWVAWAASVSSQPAFALLALTILLFPTGRPPSHRWRWLQRLVVAFVSVATIVRAIAPWIDPVHQIANPIGLGSVPWLENTARLFPEPVGALFILPAVVSVWMRWRRSVGVERQQIKWLGLASLVTIIEIALTVVYALGVAPGLLGDPEVETTAGMLVGDFIFIASVAAIPIAIGLGIVRYRLYDIDRIISRTIVFGILAVGLVAIYTAVVTSIGHAIGERTGSTTAAGLAATAVVAVLFHPVRMGLQRRVDRLVFGERAEPSELMTRFGHELARVVEVEDVLSSIAEAAGTATRSAGAVVSIDLSDGVRLSSVWGDASGDTTDDVVIPIGGAADVQGEIRVRRPAHPLFERRLLERIASISEAAMSNLRLFAELESLHATITEQNAELTRSETRLRAAASDERRRLQTTVAEQLGPLMSRLRRGLPPIVMLAGVDPGAAAVECRRLVTTATHLVGTIRSISHGILPPVLVDLGLVPALRALVRRLDVESSLSIADGLAALPADRDRDEAVFLGTRSVVERSLALGAQRIDIRLTCSEGCLATEVSVWDEGGMLEADDLEVVRDRLRSGRGDLTVEWSGDRTTARCWLPAVREPSGVPAIR